MKTLRLLFVLWVSCVPWVSWAADKPNFVFIIADDLGWADVAFHGGNAPTPHLDRLAAEGVELAQHYVYPVCSPTRSALLSGRYATRFGVTNPQNNRAYPWDTVTLASALKSTGYDTAICGKWHLGSKPEEGPQKFGFDHGYGSLAGGVGPWDHHYKKGAFMKTWHRNGQLIEEKGHVTDLITREAVRWIESRKDKPFFLYVPFTAVHLPIKEPAEWLAKVPANITGEVQREYAACVMHLDDAVGRIAAAVKGTNTLVVFTSDNGGSTAENNGQTYPPDDYAPGKLPGSNTPLRGEKGSVYEGGIRVATIANWPGKLKPGKFGGVAHISDWMPTFCALAGYKPERDSKWDGINLWPQLAGSEPPKPRAIYVAAPGFRSSAVRDGDWKLVVTDKEKRTELFNLATDPNEKTDLAKSRPEKVDALRQRLAELSRADRDAVAKD
ncbi:MAG: sulfatase-like hydrolase/transferase [Chthoniobacteraceae bacterium]